mmetsp:Transcript_141/g.254  ORF Transcript_141/g.254 Transcript_141/m.254 type:complete len:308 (+) Transcript_141:118-1041(+)
MASFDAFAPAASDSVDITIALSAPGDPKGASAPFDPDARKMPIPCADRIPPFLCKLYQIVHTPDTDHCIRWSPSHDSLLIVDQSVFSKQILPLYFKHNSIRSFIRQLNTYGFRKRTRAENVEFWNPNFKADRMDLLLHIKRVGTKQEMAEDDESSGSETANKVELMNVDVQVQELRRELKDMRTLMQQYLQQLDFKIAMQTHMVRNGPPAEQALLPPPVGPIPPAPVTPGVDDSAWASYLTALSPGGKQEVPPLPVQQVMQQAQQMHNHAQQVHQQQLQQLQQLQQAQQQQLMLMTSQRHQQQAAVA